MLNFNESHSSLTFRFAQSQDTHAVQHALTGIVQRMPVPTWFALPTNKEISALTSESEGFSILVLPNTTGHFTKCSDILALIMIRTQTLDEYLTKILRIIGIPPEHTALMEVVAVHEHHRGKGLQTILSRMAEEELIVRKFKDLVATVHPENTYSLKNFLKLGFE